MTGDRPRTSGQMAERVRAGFIDVRRPTLDPQWPEDTLKTAEVLRRRFDSGSAQVIFLAIRGLPISDMATVLSADERARWEKFTNEAAGRRFVAGRWLLRSALAGILGGAPGEVRLKYGEHEKPLLAEPANGAPAFNLSHTGELAVFAVTPHGRIGIDVERIRSFSDMPRLAKRILTADELAAFGRSAASKREAMLIAAWTRKEAVLKALGTGVSGSPSSVAVSLDARMEEEEFSAVASRAVPERWPVRILSVPAGYQGALALEFAGQAIATWQAVPVTPSR